MGVEKPIISFFEPRDSLSQGYKLFVSYYFPDAESIFTETIDDLLPSDQIKRPDILILNIDTDREAALHFISIIRHEDSPWKDIPIVTSSVDEDAEFEKYLLEIGSSAHILNPLHMDDFYELIQNLLDNSPNKV